MKIRSLLTAMLISITLLPVFADDDIKLLTKTVNLSWAENITIEGSSFFSAKEGSTIEIKYRNIKADYHKFKIYGVSSSWEALGFGGVSGAKFTNGDFETVEKSGKIVIKLTESDAANLKKGGLLMHGYGLKVTKITLSIEGVPLSETETAEEPERQKSQIFILTSPRLPPILQRQELDGWENL